MRSLKLKVGAVEAGSRLDRLLSEACPEQSRASIQKAIAAGSCTVNGSVVSTPAARAVAGQEICLDLPAADPVLAPEEGELEIVWQDQDLAVCRKPAGLTVHPCPSCPGGTLVQRLLRAFPDLARQGGLRPGIVQRLDKDTSGLMVVALTETARMALAGQFARHEICKEYLAMVQGIAPESGECRLPIGRDTVSRVRMAIAPEKLGGRPAHSRWRRLWADEERDISLLSVRIFTGRTHQIRVHMAHLGYPLLGDRVYAPAAARKAAPRQLLHAWRLGFRHPLTGEDIRLESAPDAAFFSAALQGLPRAPRLVITGNPGCGKSALSGFLRESGLPVISADAVVARLYAPGSMGAEWLAQRFGLNLLNEKGGLDKDAILARMRADEAFRRDFEQTVQEIVLHETESFFEAQASGTLAAAEIPLYFECGWPARFPVATVTVGVDCPQARRFERIRSQRGWPEEKLAALESWQWPEEKKMAACDFCVPNRGSLEELAAQAARLPERMRQWQADRDAGAIAAMYAAIGRLPWPGESLRAFLK